MTDRRGRLVSFSKLEGAEHDGASCQLLDLFVRASEQIRKPSRGSPRAADGPNLDPGQAIMKLPRKLGKPKRRARH